LGADLTVRKFDVSRFTNHDWKFKHNDKNRYFSRGLYLLLPLFVRNTY